MGTLSPDELAGAAMHPTWLALHPVRDRDATLTRFLHEELPPSMRLNPTAEGLTEAFRLCAEFNTDIWPHRVPTNWELILADRAGHLNQTIKEINAAYARGE